MVSCPPRHGKSTLVSQYFPAWYLGRNPNKFVISASYGMELAQDFGRDVRNIVGSPEYRALFPLTYLSADSQAKDRWHTSSGGAYAAAGIGTGVTGRGAHLLNIDDPVKDRHDAESELTRRLIWDWYRAVAYPRLEENAAVIVTMTRWHEQDLVGMLLEQEAEEGGQQWDKLILPAIDDEGHALWPEKYPRVALDEIRKIQGEYDWSALYDQRPTKPGGAFFDESCLLVDGKPLQPPQNVTLVYAAIDTAMKEGSRHDGLAVSFWGKYRHIHWVPGIPLPRPWLCLLDWDYCQIEGGSLEMWLPQVFTRLEQLAVDLRSLEGSRGAFIEDQQSGTVLLQQGRNRKWPVKAIDSKMTKLGKSGRAWDVSGYVRQGLVKWSQFAFDKRATFKGSTKNHMRSQVLDFRVGSEDKASWDLFDTFTYAIALGLGNREGF